MAMRVLVVVLAGLLVPCYPQQVPSDSGASLGYRSPREAQSDPRATNYEGRVLDVDDYNFNYDITSEQAYRLPQIRQYMLVAPEVVRPGTDFTIMMSVGQLLYGELNVRVMLTRDEESYAENTFTFTHASTRELAIRVPEGTLPGHHELIAEGYAQGLPGKGQLVFRNFTELVFEPKYISLFIITDRPSYDPDFDVQVNYRVIGIRPDLTPAEGAMTIFLRDGKGLLVRRWLMQQLRFGIYEGSFEMTYPCADGIWHLEIEAFGHRYKQSFEVEFWRYRRYELNVTAPPYIYDTDGMFGITVFGEHMTNKKVHGNGTVLLQCLDSKGQFLAGNITKKLRYLEKEESIVWTRNELSEVWGGLMANTSLRVEVWLYDWEWDETQNATSVTRIVADTIKLQRLGPLRAAFQPNKTFSVYFSVSAGDGTPYNGSTNRLILVEVTHDAEGEVTLVEDYNIVLPEDSIIRITVTPRWKDRIITIKATHVATASADYIEMYRHQNENGRYVFVQTSTPEPSVGKYFVATVQTSFWVSEVHYLVTGNGHILFGDTLTMSTRQKTFSFSVSRQMAPRGRLIVFCYVDDQVVMDTVNFHVHHTQLYEGTLRRNLGKDLRHDSLELLGRYKKGAFMATSSIQHDWYKRGMAPFLTAEWVIEELETYDCGHQGAYKHTWAPSTDPYSKSVYFSSYNRGLDANSTLQHAGLVVLTDMSLITNTECQPWSVVSEWCDWLWEPEETQCESPSYPDRQWYPVSTYHRHHYTDVSWAWDGAYFLGSHPNQAEIRLNVPNQVETHALHAIFMHPDDGLSLSQDVVMHDMRRRLYFSCDAPPAIIRRGEMIGVRCLLINFWDQNIEVTVTMHGGDVYRFVVVESYGIVSSYAPRTKAGDIETLVWLWPGEERYIHFPFVSTIGEGEFDVSYSAFTQIYSRTETIHFSITWDGVFWPEFTPFTIDLTAKPSIITPYLESELPEQWWTPQSRDQKYIPGSLKGWWQAFGDVVWPDFWADYYTTWDTVAISNHMADGYIFEFGLNLAIIKYMRAMEILKREPEVKILSFLKTVLPRIYSYMDDDGSMKMFRRSDEPCTWLTAYALENLHMMFVTEWEEEVFIDGAILNKMAVWLTTRLDQNGAFTESSRYFYSSNYIWNTTDTEGVVHKWNVSTTAYVTMVLAQASGITGEAKQKVNDVLEISCEYLANMVPKIGEPLEMAQTAYALHACGHNSKDYAYSKLMSMKRQDDLMYWSNTEIEKNPTQVIDGKHFLQHRPDVWNLAQACMATGYAMMLMAARGLTQELKPAMVWLNDQRMTMFAWAATQDSLVAIRALTEFAKLSRHQEHFNMRLRVEATCCENYREFASLNSSNMPNYYEVMIPEGWGAVIAYAEGTGYAYFGYNTLVYTEKESQVDDVFGYPTFEVVNTAVEFTGRNASEMMVTIKFRWENPNWRPTAGMSWFMIEIPTGFYVDRDEIERIHRDPYTLNVGRVRYMPVENYLIVFLEQITAEWMTFTFNARRWYPVANMTSCHLVQTMEYADAPVFRNIGYSTFTLHHLNICRACGSFQCPYCQHYNRAPPRVAGRWGALLVGLLLWWTVSGTRWHRRHR